MWVPEADKTSSKLPTLLAFIAHIPDPVPAAVPEMSGAEAVSPGAAQRREDRFGKL